MRDMMGLLSWLRSGPTNSDKLHENNRLSGTEKQHLARFLKKESDAGRLKWYGRKGD